MTIPTLKIGNVVQIRSKPWYGCIGYIESITNGCYIISSKRLGGVAVRYNDVALCTEEYMKSDKILPVVDPQELHVRNLLSNKYYMYTKFSEQIEYLENALKKCEQGGIFDTIKWNKFLYDQLLQTE